MSTQSANKRILVAGIGNVFHGDDAFGVEVAQAMMQQDWPAAVQVGEFGIRSYDLAYALMDGYEAVILVDATQREQPPGTVSLIEPDLHTLDKLDGEVVNGHSMNPVRVLHLVQSLGGDLPQMPLYLIGCEPAVLETQSGHLGLSDPVQAAVPKAIDMTRSLVQDLLRDDREATPALAEASINEGECP